MRVSVQIISFCCFLFPVTFVQGQVVTCELTSNFEVIRVIPEGKTIFRAGESVTIICSEKTWFSSKETSRSFKCQDDGKWNYNPVCEVITCEPLRDQHVSTYFWRTWKLDESKNYECDWGYYKKAEVATCTRDGVIPKPLCAEIVCAAPDLQNAKITRGQKSKYILNSAILYECHPGFEPQGTVQITCISPGQWAGIRQCTEIICEPPKLPNAEIVSNQKPTYKISSIIEYKCHPGFEPEELVRITCNYQGQWTGIQECSDGTCQEQQLKNIKIVFGYPTISSPYKTGHILLFQCTDDNMRLSGQFAIKCQPDGRWNYPYPQCGGTIECLQPTKNMQYVTLFDKKSMYSNSEILRYTCNEPYNQIPEGALMCQNGQWNGTFDCRNKICPPPPYVKNGDYSIISKTADNVITAVSYTCQSFFVLNKQQENYKCVNGIWETPPKCLRPCEVDKIVEKYNLQLPKEKVYIKHADTYRLNCRDGWNTGSEMKAYVDVSCSNGNLQFDQSCDTQNK